MKRAVLFVLFLAFAVPSAASGDVPQSIATRLIGLSHEEKSILMVLTNFSVFKRLDRLYQDPGSDLIWVYKVTQTANAFVAFLASDDNPDIAKIASDRAANFLGRIRGEISNDDFFQREHEIVDRYKSLHLEERAFKEGEALSPDRRQVLTRLASEIGDQVVLDAMFSVARR